MRRPGIQRRPKVEDGASAGRPGREPLTPRTRGRPTSATLAVRGQPASLGPYRDVDSIARAPGRRDGEPRGQRHLKVHIDAAWREEAINVGVVQRLDANHMRTWRQTRNLKRTALAERESTDECAGPRIERHDMRPDGSGPVAAQDPAGHRARVVAKITIRVEIGDAGDVIRLQRAVGRDSAP